jgi:hypothetical protein
VADWVNIKAQYLGDALITQRSSTNSILFIVAFIASPHLHLLSVIPCLPCSLCPVRSYSVRLSCSALLNTRHLLICFFFQVGIYISNIGSIAILWMVYMGFITERKCFQSSCIPHAHQFASAFLVLSAVLSIFALSVFPVV